MHGQISARARTNTLYMNALIALIRQNVGEDADTPRLLAKALSEAINKDQTRKIEIIKELRMMTGLGLKDAKDKVDEFMPFVAKPAPDLSILA